MNPYRENDAKQGAAGNLKMMQKRPSQFTMIWHVFSFLVILKVMSKWPFQPLQGFWLTIFALFTLSCCKALLHVCFCSLDNT